MDEPGPAAAPDVPYHGTMPALHNVCVAAAVLGPVGLLLPPRTMGMRSLLLAGGTFFATSQLAHDYTGRSLMARFQRRAAQATNADLPEAAQQRSAAMRAERARRRQAAGLALATAAEPTPAEDWTKERARREKAVLDAGGGYWELIVEQIGDVWADLRKSKPAAAATTPTEPKR